MNQYRITYSFGNGVALVYLCQAESEGEAFELFEEVIENRYGQADVLSIVEMEVQQ